MATKWKNNSGKSLLLVVLCAALAGTIMCNAYPYFRERAQKKIETSQGTEKKQEDQFIMDEEFERYLLSSIYYMNYEMTPDMDAYTYFTQNYDMDKLSAEEQASIEEASGRLMKNMRNQYTTVQSMNNYASYASGVDKDYGTDNNLYQAIKGNLDFAKEYYQSGIAIAYDSRGVPSIRESWNISMEQTEVLGYLQQATMNRLMDDNGLLYVDENAEVYDEETGELLNPYEVAESNDTLLSQLPVPLIQNASFAFGIRGNTNGNAEAWERYWEERDAFMTSGYMIGVFAIAAVMAVLALIFQNVPALELRKNRLFRLPAELVAFVGMTGIGITFSSLTSEFCVWSLGNGTDGMVNDFETLGFGGAAPQAAVVFVWLFWSVFAFGWYWLIASLLPYITHPIRTLKEQMLCISFCRWLKKLWLRFWHWATDMKVDEKMTKNIWKLVALNGLVVAALCCIWFGGIVGTVIYSVLLYILVKRKCGQIQENYQKLLHVTRAIAKGELNTPTDEDMGAFNPIRDELVSIQNGFRKAVSEEVRSRNMKTELITNVSHDLKTPLTAIITYVDLLKKEDITEEERKNYIETLDKKSQRLKVLIEDLFEVSKATTDNITMNFEDVDLVSLMKQVRLENEDKISESTLDFRWNLPEEKCILTLDPQRMFRVIDNLIQNILKYAMPYSRVYIDMKAAEGEVKLSFKNMSAAEMNFSAEEITERFVRGDLSRNTEGSGLGLAIAQSFTELQNGIFKVETDGDLFKVTIVFQKQKL